MNRDMVMFLAGMLGGVMLSVIGALFAGECLAEREIRKNNAKPR